MNGLRFRQVVAGTLAASVAALGCRPGNAGGIADNQDALQMWSEATGDAAPTLVDEADGTTSLRWGNASLDTYARTTSGGYLLTPYASGAFHRGTFEGGMETTRAGDGKSWFRIALTESNDRAVLIGSTQLDQVQFGYASGGQRFELGDMALTHSTLSANTPLKGLRWQGSFESTRLSAAAGVVSESWEALGDGNRRMLFLREAVSVKAEQLLGGAGTVYATAQSFGDRGDLSADYATVARSTGHSATIGANLLRGALSVQTEAALSQATEEGGTRAAAHAFIVDATWQHRAWTLRSGLHDFGPRFASLSVAALPGLRERYANAAWRASAWATLTFDLRSTFDRTQAPIDPATLEVAGAGRTSAQTLQLNLAPPQLPGSVVTLVASRSRGHTLDEIRTDQASASATLAMTRGAWTSQATIQRGHSHTDAALTGASVVAGASGSVARSWGDAATAWNVQGTLSARYQSQRFATGVRNHVQSGGARITAVHSDQGAASLQLDVGSGRDALGNPLALRNLRLAIDRPVRPQLAMKLYAAWTNNHPQVPEIAYRERLLGVQFTYSF